MKHGLTLLLAIVVAGCGGERVVEPGAVAQVGDAEISREALDLYFELNLLADEDETVKPGGRLDRVKSRMLDALIDETILLAEAERRGLEATGAEVSAEVPGADAEQEEASLERRREHVRQRIMVQKLLDRVAQEQPGATDEEIRAWVDRALDGAEPQRRLRLRSLRLDSAETAVGVGSLIRDGSMSFDDAVATHGSGPDQGVPMELAWDTLPEDVQQALADLDPGQVSGPVDFRGDTFLFQVEAWLADAPEVDEETARRELGRDRIRTTHETLLRDLRAKTTVKIHVRRLPFRYLPDKDV